MNEENKSRIEGLNDRLNSRTRYRNPLDKRSPVKEFESSEVGEKWQTPELDEMLKHERIPPKISPFMKKIFIFALIFFIVAIGITGFVFVGGANFVSSKNVDINVLGPTAISAGEVLELGATISNRNNADLEFANLSIQYPQGSRNPDNTVESLTYAKESLGVIKAGAETVRNVRVVFLGSSGEIKEVKLSVEYKVKGSNATFYKDKIFEVVIGNSPIVLKVENPSSTVSGEPFTMKVSIALNSTEVLKNVILKAEYPHGYSVLDSSQKPVDENNVWALGDLTPGDKKTISIRGQLVGEDQEERTFRFYVGVSDSLGVGNNLKIVIVSLLNTIVIDRPSIGLDVLFNGENVPIYVAPVARTIHTSFRFKNNLSDKLLNPRLEVSLSGVALDKLSIKAGSNGLYDPGSSKIVWNLTNSLGLPELAPGESGQVTLDFSSLMNLSPPKNIHEVLLNFLVTGVPVNTIGQGTVSVSDTRIVRISSQVNFSSKVLRSLGPFANSGPIPPKIGEETTYAIVFNVGNTRGDLTDTKVTAHLGQGVSYLGASSFTSENISYDSLSNTVTWNLSMLPSDTGFSSAPRELAFQISLKPSLSQIGTAPNVLTDIVFSGRDTVTGDTVTVNNFPLTTRLINDPAFIQGDDIVVK
jgi:hypothetical protein